MKPPAITADSAGPVIGSCQLGPGHDGRAEIVVELVFPNGARSQLSVGEAALGRALDAAGLSSAAELSGRPWTVLVAGLDFAGVDVK